MEKTVVRNAYVASQDPLIGNQADLDILIEGNLIVAVGRNLDVGDAAVVDATGCILAGFC
jgi:dihydroorotase-like cyclic amidohydrolase